ncbi:MAG: AAA family ATPase [Thermoplasmata archaeon]|nr:AAA family ATPase [Thermoplasmata archaeon]
MFKAIELRNFRSFEHITLDLTARGKIVDHALLYGENGSGKTNLAEAVSILRRSMEAHPGTEGLRRTVLAARAAGSEGPTVLRYEFTVDGRDAEYEIRYGEDGVLSMERLAYLLKDRIGRYFEIVREPEGVTEDDELSGIEIKVGRDLIPDGTYRRRVLREVRDSWGDHTLLSILCRDYGCLGDSMDTAVRPEMRRIVDTIRGVCVYSPRRGVSTDVTEGFDLVSGCIPSEDSRVLDAYSEAVSKFLSRLCTDIRGTHYAVSESDGILEYTLMVERRMNGEYRSIPAEDESTGVLKLVSMLPYLLECVRGGTAVLDEADSGIHEMMFRDLLMDVIGTEGRGQLIVTTHCIPLIQEIEPSSVFILRLSSLADKEISSIASICRTQKGHNNSMRYRDGLFDGVPYTGNVFIECIAEDLYEGLGAGR